MHWTWFNANTLTSVFFQNFFLFQLLCWKKFQPTFLYLNFFNCLNCFIVLLTFSPVTKELLVIICISLDWTWLIPKSLNLIYSHDIFHLQLVCRKNSSLLFCLFDCSSALLVQFLLLVCSEARKKFPVFNYKSVHWTWFIANTLNSVFFQNFFLFHLLCWKKFQPTFLYLNFFNCLTCFIVLLTCSKVLKNFLVITCNSLDWTWLILNSLSLFYSDVIFRLQLFCWKNITQRFCIFF